MDITLNSHLRSCSCDVGWGQPCVEPGDGTLKLAPIPCTPNTVCPWSGNPPSLPAASACSVGPPHLLGGRYPSSGPGNVATSRLLAWALGSCQSLEVPGNSPAGTCVGSGRGRAWACRGLGTSAHRMSGMHRCRAQGEGAGPQSTQASPEGGLPGLGAACGAEWAGS